MNKKFSKLLNRTLALVLSLGMVFGAIPNTSLTADAAQVTEQVATVGELNNESGYEANWTRTVNEPGNIQFSCNKNEEAGINGKLRLRGYLSEGYVYTPGDVVTIKYTTALNGTEVELCYNTEAAYVRLGTLDNSKEEATFTLPETDKLGGDIQPKYIRFKNNNCDAGNTFGVYGITFSRTAEKPDEPEPTPIPEPTGVPAQDGPKFAIDTNNYDTVTGYKFTDNADGSVTIDYTKGVWYKLFYSVTDSDVSKYSKLVIDLTPAQDMILGVRATNKAGTEIKLRDHWAKEKMTATRQVLEYTLTEDIDNVFFYVDPILEDGEASSAKSFTINSIKLVDPNYVAPSVDKGPKATIADSDGFTLDRKADGSVDVTYQVETWHSLKVNIEDCDYEKFDQIQFDITPYPGMVLGTYYGEMGDDGKEHDKALKGHEKLTTEGRQFYTVKLTKNLEQIKMFCDAPNAGADTSEPTTRTFTIHGIKFLNSNGTEAPTETRYAKVNVAQSGGYTGTVNADGSVTFKYSRKGVDNYDTIKIDIANDDFDTYDQLRIDFTPAKNMTMAVLTTNPEKEEWYRHHNDFDSNERQILKINLKKDDAGKDVQLPVTGVRLFCDSNNLLTEDRELTIHKVWLCKSSDPDFVPADKAKFYNFRGSGFTIEEQKEDGFATLGYKKGETARLYMEFKDYSYNAGDVFVMEYDGTDFDALKTVESMIGWTDGDTGHYKFKAAKEAGSKYIYFELPADTEGKFTAEKPANYVRFKGTLADNDATIHVNGLHIYDGDEWRKFISSFTYNEEDCPQGVAVSYYSDIYSRGFAWATTDQIDEQVLQYVKVTDGMAKDTVDWESSDVITVPATRGADRVDVSNVTWHMYKVHVENLEPGSYWFFRVGLKDKGFSDVGSFKIEEAETDKLTFVHLTDCQEGNQSGYTRWAKVLDAAYQMAPDSKFVAFTGDLTNDSHANLTMTQWNWGLGEPKKNLLNTVIMPSAGNHDEWEYSFTDRFDIKWADYIKAGGVHPVNGKTYTDDQENLDIKTGGCYSFLYGDDIAFINLNTNDTNNLPDDFQSQYNWLVEQLEKYKDVKWKIVQVHKGMMSTGNHTNDGEVDQLRDLLPPLFAHYKVDLVLQGHDHVYTRSRTYYYGNDFDGEDYGGIKIAPSTKPGYTYEVKQANNKYTGQKPCWLEGVIYDGRDDEHAKWIFQGKERELTNLEPLGTHYVTINYCANKSYAVADNLDSVIYPGKNPIPENGTSIQLKNSPMYGVIQIDGDTLIYDSYVYNTATKESTLYDTFAVAKGDTENVKDGTWNRGYRDRHEGMTEASIQNILIKSKKYDGHPVELNLKGFVSSEPTLIDYSLLEFHITGDNGFDSTTELPKEKGHYHMVVTIDNVIETESTTLLYYGKLDDATCDFTIE